MLPVLVRLCERLTVRDQNQRMNSSRMSLSVAWQVRKAYNEHRAEVGRHALQEPGRSIKETSIRSALRRRLGFRAKRSAPRDLLLVLDHDLAMTASA